MVFDPTSIVSLLSSQGYQNATLYGIMLNMVLHAIQPSLSTFDATATFMLLPKCKASLQMLTSKF